MTKEDFLEELRALRQDTNESLEEIHRPLTQAHLVRLATKTRELFKSFPGMYEIVEKEYLDNLSAEDQSAVEALHFLTQGLALILCRPEIQKSAAVTSVMHAIHKSIAELTVFDANEDTILRAFGAPALSQKNSRIAKNLRSNKDNVQKAEELYIKWEENPNLYKTKTAFARDCIRKEYSETERTVFGWLSRFSKDVQAGHPLYSKLNKLVK